MQGDFFLPLDPEVEDGDCGGSFEDGGDAAHEGGVVAAFYFQLSVFPLSIDGVLFFSDGGGGLDGDGDFDGVSCGDAAEDSAGAVSCGTQVAVFFYIGVVVLAAF